MFNSEWPFFSINISHYILAALISWSFKHFYGKITTLHSDKTNLLKIFVSKDVAEFIVNFLYKNTYFSLIKYNKNLRYKYNPKKHIFRVVNGNT